MEGVRGDTAGLAFHGADPGNAAGQRVAVCGRRAQADCAEGRSEVLGAFAETIWGSVWSHAEAVRLPPPASLGVGPELQVLLVAGAGLETHAELPLTAPGELGAALPCELGPLPRPALPPLPGCWPHALFLPPVWQLGAHRMK